MKDEKEIHWMSQKGIEVRRPIQQHSIPLPLPKTIHIHHTREVTKTRLFPIPLFI